MRHENSRLQELLELARGDREEADRHAPKVNEVARVLKTPRSDRAGSSATGRTPLPAKGLRPAAALSEASPSESKVAFFAGLFRGREDAYAVRWESRNDRSGYSPACEHEWDSRLCAKPKVRCPDCAHRELLPLTDAVIFGHLTGKHVVGTYPLLADDTCRFLVVDFDKTCWQDDVSAFVETCREMGLPVAVERSRSGNGAHVWFFFDRAVAARQARRFGCAVLTNAMELRHQIGLDSYDRLFPNQDTMPKGGFGNLIALPLQHDVRGFGNSLFLDDNLEPYPDQWTLLSGIGRVGAERLDTVVREAAAAGSIIGVRIENLDDEAAAPPWALPPSGRLPERVIIGPFPETVDIVHSNMVYVGTKGLPSSLLNRLCRLAAFQNPEYYKAQAMRLSTFGKPRVISCAEEFAHHIGLPRGCLQDVLDLLSSCGINTCVADERFAGTAIDLAFRGRLTPGQLEAAEALLPHDIGVLSAATAFGKTVIAAWLIARRGVNTLVLVHRRQLLDQWRERLAAFLDLPLDSIGQIGGGKAKLTGTVDIGVLQTLGHKGQVKDCVAEYGQVIVDECHHIPAFTFERVLKAAKARYVLGLTATPFRKDGHHPIITMQCGPIRFGSNTGKHAAHTPFERVVIARRTAFSLDGSGTDLGIQGLYGVLARDNGRNDLIAGDVLSAVESGSSPLVLTERTEHVDHLAERLTALGLRVVVMHGRLTTAKRRAAAEQLASIPADEPRVLIATGRCIGEGFDDPRLDALFLALPISWRGTLQQYAGRLHRVRADKQVVRIYDYADTNVPMLARMYERRLKGYQAMGYAVSGGGIGVT